MRRPFKRATDCQFCRSDDGGVFMRLLARGVDASLRRKRRELGALRCRLMIVMTRVLERYVERNGSRHRGRKEPHDGNRGNPKGTDGHEDAILSAAPE